MKLNDTQKNHLSRKLAGLNSICTFCKNDGFTVLDRIFEMREFNQGDLIIGGDSSTIIPAVILTCDNCGEIRLLSALTLGVIDNSEKQVKKDDVQ